MNNNNLKNTKNLNFSRFFDKISPINKFKDENTP